MRIAVVGLGRMGLAASCPGAVVMDMSTGSPELARRMAAAGAARAVQVLDAPVSGGPRGAAAGTLAIMVGGDADAFTRVLPVLHELGQVIAHMGPAGAGQAMKLTNNLLASAHMAVLAEAVAFARREGLDPAAVYEVISGGTGDSRALRNRCTAINRAPRLGRSAGGPDLLAVDHIASPVAPRFRRSSRIEVRHLTSASPYACRDAAPGDRRGRDVHRPAVARR
jgi:NAD binding domain of 6-phosphogluconate dehydrogenase/NAD-binding of NADP-dependent 3-hydroxyisobutyrate dehydrogenase